MAMRHLNNCVTPRVTVRSKAPTKACEAPVRQHLACDGPDEPVRLEPSNQRLPSRMSVFASYSTPEITTSNLLSIQ